MLMRNWWNKQNVPDVRKARGSHDLKEMALAEIPSKGERESVEREPYPDVRHRSWVSDAAKHSSKNF